MPFAAPSYRLTEAERSLLARITALHAHLIEEGERDGDELALTHDLNDRLVSGAVEPNRLRTWREETLEMTQAELADAVNVSPPIVSAWERGEERPGEGPLARLRQLARKYD